MEPEAPEARTSPETSDAECNGNMSVADGSCDSLTKEERGRSVKLEIEDEEGVYEALYSASEPSLNTLSGNSSDIDEEDTLFDARTVLEGNVKEKGGGNAGVTGVEKTPVPARPMEE